MTRTMPCLMAATALSFLSASVPAGGGSGRVVEYADNDRPPVSSGTESRPQTRGRENNREADAVQLITGGDSEDGSAKVGRLPVLD